MRFVEPAPQTVLSGLAPVRVDISVPETITKYELGIEGQELTSLSMVASTLNLDTTSMPNGEATLVVKATASSGKEWSDAVSVTIKNASHQLMNYGSSAETYAKGEQVVLDLTYPVAGLAISADFSKLDDQFDASAVSVSDEGNGHYQLKYTISREDTVTSGQYSVNLIATNAANETVTTRVELKLRERPRLPLEIPGATFVDDDSEPVVVVPDSVAPGIQSVAGATRIFSGMAANLDLEWSQTPENPVDRIIVRSPNYSGYLVLPVDDAASQKASLPLHLSPQAEASTSQQTLDLLLSAIDATGATNGWTPTTLAKYVLEPFGTLVTLWWDNPMDLDLEVTTPQGNTIGYEHRSADGGRLEMDSNAMCSLDYVNTERASWPMGAASTGTYTVSARLYDACGQSQASYHVLVSVCGRLQEYSGSFSAADLRTADAVQKVGTFEVDCAKRAHGSVTYRHQNPKRRNEVVPVAFVPVRAVTGSDSSLTVWGEGTTNDRGAFDFYVRSDAPNDYEIEIESSWTPPNGKAPLAQVVTQPGNKLHQPRWPAIASLQAAKGGQSLVLAEAAAGAFNILDKLRRGYSWVSGHLSSSDAKKVKPVSAHWSQGVAAPQGGSYYNDDGNIYMGGLPSDRAEFDDSVISHEFMHHVTYHIMGAGPGGEHSFAERSNPALAWNEGLATAFGQQALGSPIYFDGDYEPNKTWIATFDLESSHSDITNMEVSARETSNGKMSGKVGEGLVSMVLWDMLDPVGTAREKADTIESTYAQTLASIMRYLPRNNRADRGASGRDLVDFLDGWRCQWPTLYQRDADLTQLLSDRLFPYDYSTGIKCK